MEEARRELERGDQILTEKAREARTKGLQFKSDAENKARQIGNETTKELKETVDNFDKTVERKTKEAKTGIASWFGFGK